MTVKEFNSLPEEDANQALYNCCGSNTWVDMMLDDSPFDTLDDLKEKASFHWFDACTEEDWLEAFSQHPKIGDLDSLTKKFANTKAWAGNEQASVQQATPEVLQALAKANQAYEEKFGYIFIVCATGKSAQEMLDILNDRLGNDKREELVIAMNEQYKITNIRLNKLFQ